MATEVRLDHQTEAAITPLWFALSHTTGGFEDAREQLLRSDLRSRIVFDAQMLRIPIDINLAMPERRIID